MEMKNHLMQINWIIFLLQIDYMGNPIEVDLCKNSKNRKIEIDYSQRSVKMFFDQSAKCGQNGKRIIIIYIPSQVKSLHLFMRFQFHTMRYIM